MTVGEEPFETRENGAPRAEVEGSLLSPASFCVDQLSRVERQALIAAQQSDPSLTAPQANVNEGVPERTSRSSLGQVSSTGNIRIPGVGNTTNYSCQKSTDHSFYS